MCLRQFATIHSGLRSALPRSTGIRPTCRETERPENGRGEVLCTSCPEEPPMLLSRSNRLCLASLVLICAAAATPCLAQSAYSVYDITPDGWHGTSTMKITDGGVVVGSGWLPDRSRTVPFVWTRETGPAAFTLDANVNDITNDWVRFIT